MAGIKIVECPRCGQSVANRACTIEEAKNCPARWAEAAPTYTTRTLSMRDQSPAAVIEPLEMLAGPPRLYPRLLRDLPAGTVLYPADVWLEAAIAWEVCASIHRQWAKGKDPMFKTRQADFVRHAAEARAKVPK